MGKSLYPNSIDTDVTLPQVRDAATELRGDVTNSLKSAILAVEKTLGINPQGTQPTLKDRLNVSLNQDGTLKQSALVTTAVADRNFFLTDGGLLTWDISTSALTWAETLNLRFPGTSGVSTSVSASTAFLLVSNDVLYITPSRTGSNPTQIAKVGNLSNNTLAGQDIVILAIRDESGIIHWRNGTVMPPNSSLKFGGAVAADTFFDSIDSYSSANNVQDVLDEMDAYAFAVDRDRNLTLVGDAYGITFNSGTGAFSWTGDFVLQTPMLGANAIIRDSYNSPLMFTGDGYVAVAKIDQTQNNDYFASVQMLNNNQLLAHDKDSTVLAVRDSDRIYLRNGQVVYNPTAPVKLGETSANHVAFDDSVVSFSASDVSGALVAVDVNVATVNSGLTAANNNITILSGNVSSLSTITSQDRNTYMMGGGDFQWNSGTSHLSFTQDIRLYSPYTVGDAIIQVANSPITLPTNRSVAYITLNRAAITDYNVTPVVVSADLLPNSDNIVVVATRVDATKIILKSGQVVFSGSGPTEQGEVDGYNVTFNPAGTSLVSTNMQAALAELDNIVSSMTPGALPSGTVIMFNGGSCPPGTVALPALTGGYPRAAAAASLALTGSNTHDHGTHTHTGSTNTTGAHTHSLSGGVLTGHGVPPVSFSNLGFGSAAEIGHGHDGSSLFGSATSAGNHSHTLSVNGSTVPFANHEPVRFDVKFCQAT